MGGANQGMSLGHLAINWGHIVGAGPTAQGATALPAIAAHDSDEKLEHCLFELR